VFSWNYEIARITRRNDKHWKEKKGPVVRKKKSRKRKSPHISGGGEGGRPGRAIRVIKVEI